MILTTIIIIFCYAAIIIALSIGFEKVSPFNNEVKSPVSKFSIIIPFRNEEANLTELLNSLVLLNYPKEYYEILMINDASDDASIQRIEHFKTKHPSLPILILENSRKSVSPKKDAIETAINVAQFDWIITTDADCILPKTWLQTYDAFIQTHESKLIAAPVTYAIGNGFLEHFQLFDFLSLQASTIGGFGLKKPFLCNGANLCYQKSAFIEVHGFKGNDKIASGDDIFLLEKMTKKFPDNVHFLKSSDAVVITKPQPSFKSLISQRVRWASKTTSVKSRFTKLVGLIVLLMNFLWISSFILYLVGYINWQYLFTVITLKIVVDFVLLIKAFHFFKQSFNFLKFILNSFCYPFFSMFVIILSFKKGYQWKNRMFKK
ncbi:glycosyltransferase [Aureibaculum sp. A20]|uniref:Glycosyltransferase n=1 Tax=Aureibaculum flavum TaxID=2795986 RepID=A0ABS0WSB4_9FLAO|nr:glycosyltransferase [Aureibaculum flavum]MBJ2174847.1 glycosyltransferase [Aureibaculum flavum]